MHVRSRALKIIRRAAFNLSMPPVRRWLRGRREGPQDVPPPGLVRFGSLRRVDPISRKWGEDRGGPLDRYYIESFLKANTADIRGHVMEIAEDVYTRWFGGKGVSRIDILAYDETETPDATIIADLTSADHIASNTFDCVIVTQTLQLVYDVRAAVGTIHRILKPGGIALVTVPGISQINRHDTPSWGDYWYWNFTALSIGRLFGEHFPSEGVTVQSHGNVLVATAFLYGLGRDELTRAEMNHHDPDYEVLISVRARKAGEAP